MEEINQHGIKLFGTFIPTPPPEPAFPNLQAILDFLGVVENRNPTHLFSKTLLRPDTTRRGLSIRRDRIITAFLTDQEERDLCEGRKLVVKVIDPSLKVRDLSLSRWKHVKAVPSYSYELNGGGWREIVERNGLAPGKTIQVWSFRFGVEESLGFLIFEAGEWL